MSEEKQPGTEQQSTYIIAHEGMINYMLGLTKENKLDILYSDRTLENIIGTLAFVREIFIEQFNKEVAVRQEFVMRHRMPNSEKALRDARGNMTYTALKKTGVCIEMMTGALDKLSESYKEYLKAQVEKGKQEETEAPREPES